LAPSIKPTPIRKVINVKNRPAHPEAIVRSDQRRTIGRKTWMIPLRSANQPAGKLLSVRPIVNNDTAKPSCASLKPHSSLSNGKVTKALRSIWLIRLRKEKRTSAKIACCLTCTLLSCSLSGNGLIPWAFQIQTC